MAFEVLLGFALFFAATFFAVARGGPPERIATGIIVCWVISDVSYHLVFGPSGFDAVDPVHLVLDGGELVAIVWLALRANRMWPLWAAAAQLICVSGHVAVLISPEGMRRAYWAMTQLPPYIQLVAVFLGAVSHTRRLERIGPYRSWRFS
ncbi:MAG TPA: hypothetical protein VI168_03705 [Croceibacterium sp.]